MRFLFACLMVCALATASVQARPLVVATVSDEPGEKIEAFHPYAVYMAARLGEFGINGAKVLPVQDMQTMVRLVRTGEVDVYLDSAYPTLWVEQYAKSVPFLRRWKDGKGEYRSIIVTRKDGPIDTVSELRGKVIGFEDPFSTSAYFMPMSVLHKAGLTPVERMSEAVPLSEQAQVGYVFSGDARTCVLWLLRGKIDAAALGSHDLIKVRPVDMEKLRIIHETQPLSRQMVSHAPGLPPAMVARLRQIMLDMDQTEEGRAVLEKLQGTTRFDEPPGGIARALEPLEALMRAEKNKGK